MEASTIQVIPAMMAHFRDAVRKHIVEGEGAPTIAVYSASTLPRRFSEVVDGASHETGNRKFDVTLGWGSNQLYVIRPKQEGDVVLGSVPYKELTSGEKLLKAQTGAGIGNALCLNDDTKLDVHVVEIEFDWARGGAKLAEKGVTYVIAETIPGHDIVLSAEPQKTYAKAVPVAP